MGVTRELYETGQTIVRQGDVGRVMYLIQSGSVEVLATDGRAGEQRLAVLGPGEHFGEIAVLENRQRTATVRAIEPVAVLRISREQTQQLTASFKPFAELTTARRGVNPSEVDSSKPISTVS
jgi:CRP-like cAMP-binding protein